MEEEHELKGLSPMGKKTPFYRWGKNPTVTHLPARGQWYYRAWPAVLPQGRAVVLLATKRYYHTVVRYYRTTLRYFRDPQPGKQTQAGAGTTAPPMRYYRKAKVPSRGKGNFRAYFHKKTEVAKTQHSSTAEGRYYCLTA